MRFSSAAVALLVASGLVVSASPAAGAWMLGVGAFGVDSDDETSLLVDAEHRFEPRSWGIFPVVGIAATSEGGGFVCAGAGRALSLSPGWSATVSFAVTGYATGDGPDLGGALQFRSALEIGYDVVPELTVGLGVAHLSNAGLDDHNPGVETLALTAVYRPAMRR